jgi:hypothetical protein
VYRGLDKLVKGTLAVRRLKRPVFVLELLDRRRRQAVPAMNRRHRGIRLEDHRPIVPLLDDYVLAGEIHAEGHVGCGLVLARKLSHASGTATDGSAVEALTAGIGSHAGLYAIDKEP